MVKPVDSTVGMNYKASQKPLSAEELQEELDAKQLEEEEEALAEQEAEEEELSQPLDEHDQEGWEHNIERLND